MVGVAATFAQIFALCHMCGTLQLLRSKFPRSSGGSRGGHGAMPPNHQEIQSDNYINLNE